MLKINHLTAIVHDAGMQLKQWRAQKKFEGVAIGHDFKAKVDKQAHNFLVERLMELDPSIPIVSEEDPASLIKKLPERYWLIDPLDGTSSFIKGFLGFVTQVALIEHQQPIMSAVCAPMFDELFYAQKGVGAYLNGKKLLIDVQKQATTLIDNTPKPYAMAAHIYEYCGFSSYVECGSIGLKMCRVADGTADLFFKDVVVRNWDIAAPMLIVQEAGGCVMRLDGASFLFKNDYEHNGLIVSVSNQECKKIYNFFKRERYENISCSLSS